MPVVSVFCITYNHEKFIRDAIEGFLMQETTFPVQIFIHDDASNDDTAGIIREYENRFSQLFWTVLQEQNQWSKGNRKVLWHYLSQQVGEFIALCEGDDYWTSPHKLQKQVEMLDSDPAVSLVFHNCWVSHRESHRDYFLNNSLRQSRFSLADVIERDWFMATSSLVFRRLKPLPKEILSYSMGGDMLLQLAACSGGDAGYIDKVWSVYRRHDQGISDAYWQMGDFHYEKLRPNHIWMYWLLGEEVLTASSRKSVERRVRELMNCILSYAVVRKGMSRNYQDLKSYLFKVVCDNKPEFVRDEVTKPNGPLWLIMESQLKAFWKKHRKRQVQNFIRRLTNAIVR